MPKVSGSANELTATKLLAASAFYHFEEGVNPAIHDPGDAGYGQNRGCMSQNGAACLEDNNGYDYVDILRFYYGDDIILQQGEGSCVTPPPGEETTTGEPPTTAEREGIVATHREAAEHAAGYGIKLAVEPLNRFDQPGYMIPTSTQMLALIEEIGHPNIRLQYDFYHQQRMEGNLIAFFADHIGQIGHIQIADSPDRHEPGTGEIAYDYVFEQIDALGAELDRLDGGVDLVEGDLAEARAHIRAGRACVGGRLECDSRQREHAGGLGLVADQIVRIALGSALARGRKLETDPEEHACRRTHPVGNRGRRTQNAVRRCLESFQSILHPAEDETWSANGNVKGRVKGRLRTW